VATEGVVLGQRFDDALAFAGEVHRTHLRKGTTTPYISHLLGVCSLTLEDGGTEDEAIAALLHDAVEDHGAHLLVEIEQRFGQHVADIVAGCSDVLDSDGSAKPPWRSRKEAYLAHLEDADPSVLRVSNADKVHNARALLADYRSVGDELWQRFNVDARNAEAHLWYLESLAEVFGRRRGDSFLVAELAAAVESLRSLATA
jgi:(p)ppGpp synthase/HD superfamily hydrolase